MIKSEHIVSKQILLRYYDDNQPVAYVSVVFVYNIRINKWHAKIEDLFVQENFRGQGIATRLLKEAIEYAKKYGCYKITLNSRFTNNQLHNWYEKFGFKKTGFSFRMNL